jgi:hypothetical protein
MLVGNSPGPACWFTAGCGATAVALATIAAMQHSRQVAPLAIQT